MKHTVKKVKGPWYHPPGLASKVRIRLPMIVTVFLILLLSTIMSNWTPAPNNETLNNIDSPIGVGLTRQRGDFIDDDFWAECSTFKLYTTTRSKDLTPVWSAAENTIKISMARNEYESFQLAFRPMKDFSENITLAQAEGPGTLGTGNFSMHDVEYAGSFSPDPLIPMEPNRTGSVDPDTAEPESLSWDIELESGTTRALWVTVYAPSDIPPGTYRTGITFAQKDSQVTRLLEITIWSFVLPENPTLTTWFDSSPDLYTAYYPFDDRDPEHIELMKKVYEKFRTHRISPGSLGTAEPWGSDIDVDIDLNVTVNFTRSDPLMEYYLDEFDFARFAFPITPNDPVPWDSGIYDFSAPPYQPSVNYSRVIGQYIKKVADHYREKGWLDRCIFYYCGDPYPFTENCPSPRSSPPYSLQRDINDIIEANAPGLDHLIVRSIEPPLYGEGKIWDVEFNRYHPNDAAIRREAGEEIWWHDAGGGIEKPGMGLRSMYWHSFNQRVDGIKQWGMNYWNFDTVGNDPWRGSRSDGEGYMLYPGTSIGIDDDIIISIRLELTRDGLEDYEYLTKYSEKFGRESAEAVARLIQPASDFEIMNEMDVSGDYLYRVREYIARAIEGANDDLSVWQHGLNGTKSGPGPWDDHGSGNNYGNDGISTLEGLTKTWSGDGVLKLAMDEPGILLSGCDSASGWIPNNESGVNSTVEVETSYGGHVEGIGALNLSFWRSDENVSLLAYGSIEYGSFTLTDWSDFGVLEFDCRPVDISLYNFEIELDHNGESWNDEIGRYSVTGTLPGRWHHVIIDIGKLGISDLNHLRIFIRNSELEVPFQHYSLLVDNITLRSANRTLSGNVSFELLDLGPVPVGKWNVEVLGDWPLYEEFKVSVNMRMWENGTSWGEWRDVPRDNETVFSFSGQWLPERFLQLRVGLQASEIDRAISPCISEVRIWYAPVIYSDAALPANSFRITPELLTEGEEMGLEFGVLNRGDVEIGPVMVDVTADNGGYVILQEGVYLPPGEKIITLESLSLASGDHIIRISLELPIEVIDDNLADNILSVEVHVNAPPVAVIAAPETAESHKEVEFDGRGSHDPDGNITNYSWDMGDGFILTGPLVKHIYTVQKSYQLNLTVTDDSGFNVTVSRNILIGLPKPTVEIGFWPIKGNITTDYLLYPILFDPMDAVNDYNWVLPGGQERKGEQIIWRFSDDGTHNISLTIGFGYEPREVSTWKHIKVNNIPPEVRATASTFEASPGDEITFTSTGTHDVDDEMEQLSYLWDFGDGTFSEKANERHAYNRAGRFKVNFTVTDDNGDANWTSFVIYVHTDYPVADFAVPEIYVNETAVFDGSISTDPDGSVINYTWKLKGNNSNDNLSYHGERFSYVFTVPGNYTLNLTVRDDSGDLGSREKNFTVFIRDLDGDGIQDSDDGDMDGDGVPNESDAYPRDSEMWKEKEKSNAVLIVIVILVLLAVIGGIILFLFMRAKKKAATAGDEEVEMTEEEKEAERKKAYEDVYGGPENKDDGVKTEVEWGEPD